MRIEDRARAALLKARKEGRRIYFLKRILINGNEFFIGTTRKEYKEGDEPWIQTWVEGDNSTLLKEKI